MSVTNVPPRPETGDVVTLGTAGVVTLTGKPKPVPAEFEAIAQKKYVVPRVRPVMFSRKVCDELPAPRFVPPAAGARVPNVSLQVPGLVVE